MPGEGAGSATIRVGLAGWDYPDWRGIVYPQKKSKGFDELGYLARYFDTIEINSTFYRPADPKAAAGWVKRVDHNPAFKFTAKLWKRFTHERGSAWTTDDVKVQLTWTLSNLDEAGHTVEVLVDPWNEFGRYYPGMQLADAEEQKFEPNLSAIDHYYVLDGVGAGDSSRRHGTYTFDDMKEMAVDFATVQNLIKNPPTMLPNGFQSKDMGMDDPLPVYANHAFNFQNHSWSDVLSAPYVPKVIAGLTGIDFGFRTSEQVGKLDPDTGANLGGGIALEISIEIVDLGKDRVQQDGGTEPLLKPTTVVVTVGSPVPTAAPAAM